MFDDLICPLLITLSLVRAVLCSIELDHACVHDIKCIVQRLLIYHAERYTAHAHEVKASTHENSMSTSTSKQCFQITP